MRTVKWNAFLSCLCGVAVALGVATVARADVTTEKGASILIFPKVRADSTFDTIIQIANTGNSMVHARCFYVNASLVDTVSGLPCSSPSASCVPIWQETDFTIWLTKQQPTHWLVSSGRNFDPFASFGSNDAGFTPGLVPPVSDFIGELKCVEVTPTGEPLTGNHLKGEATLKVIANNRATFDGIITPGTNRGDVSKYNAIGILGNPMATPTNTLLLDGSEYDACPEKLIVNHLTTGAEDPIAAEVSAEGSSESTELTLVPCSEDFENQIPTTVTVQFLITNELEQKFSASTTVTCFLSIELASINTVFTAGFLGTDTAQTEITPVTTTSAVNAVIGVAERISTIVEAESSASARAAYNLHTVGSLIPATGSTQAPDQIRLSDE